MSVNITYMLMPVLMALVGLFIANLFRLRPRPGVTIGVIGITAGLALECWLFFGLIPENRAHGCHDLGLTSTAFWISFYLTAFASGVAVSAAKAPTWLSIVFALGASVLVASVFTFAGILNQEGPC
jgi:hypothetical protein